MNNIPGNYFDTYKGTDPYLFISYAHKDSEIVYPIINSLHDWGYNIWYDEGIDPGNEWPDEIANALEKCTFFIVFISNNSVNSKNVLDEINFALDEKKPFLAIHIQETKVPAGLRLRTGSTQAIMKYRMENGLFLKKLTKVIDGKGLRAIVQTEPQALSLDGEELADKVNPPPISDVKPKRAESGSLEPGRNQEGSIDVQPKELPEKIQNKKSIDTVLEVRLAVKAILDKTVLPIREILNYSPGYVIQTGRKAGEPIDISVNERVIAKGEIVVIDESFGVRITEIFKEKFKQNISEKDPVEIASDSHNTLNKAEPKHHEAPEIKSNIELILDVPMVVTIEIGKTIKYIKDILEFAPGSILELDKPAGEPVDINVNNKNCARGEVVVVEEYFGVRITEIIHLPALKD